MYKDLVENVGKPWICSAGCHHRFYVVAFVCGFVRNTYRSIKKEKKK
jgi:hypothetical protein